MGLWVSGFIQAFTALSKDFVRDARPMQKGLKGLCASVL